MNAFHQSLPPYGIRKPIRSYAAGSIQKIREQISFERYPCTRLRYGIGPIAVGGEIGNQGRGKHRKSDGGAKSNSRRPPHAAPLTLLKFTTKFILPARVYFSHNPQSKIAQTGKLATRALAGR